MQKPARHIVVQIGWRHAGNADAIAEEICANILGVSSAFPARYDDRGILGNVGDIHFGEAYESTRDPEDK